MILFVDDELDRTYTLRKRLMETYPGQVKIIKTVDDALQWITRAAADHTPIDLMVWDLQMPLPEVITKEQKERSQVATRTGLLVWDHLRRLLPRVPTLMLTNNRDDGLFDQIRATPGRHKVLLKRNATPDVFLQEVQSLLPPPPAKTTIPPP